MPLTFSALQGGFHRAVLSRPGDVQVCIPSLNPEPQTWRHTLISLAECEISAQRNNWLKSFGDPGVGVYGGLRM